MAPLPAKDRGARSLGANPAATYRRTTALGYDGSRPTIGSPGDHPGGTENGKDSEEGVLDNEDEKNEPESEGKKEGKTSYGPNEE